MTTNIKDNAGAGQLDTAPTSEIMLLPDGRILAHNLTPAFTALLGALNPRDPQITLRVERLAGRGLPVRKYSP